MKFAVIAPPHILNELGYATGYHLALAQELLRSKEYERYYLRASRLGHFTIVDNGAAENDAPPFDKVLDAADRIDADEIALPDELFDWEKTARLVRQWATYVPAARRFIIPQGDNVKEWCKCLEEIHADLEGSYATIGVPKHLEREPFGRQKALAYLLKEGYWRYNVHLLGVWDHTFSEIFKACQVPIRIRGLDTGAPVAQAQQGKSISHAPQQRFSLAWDTAAPSELVHRNVQSVLFWVQSMHHGARHG